MLEKKLIHNLLRRFLKNGGLEVRYWDGSTETYGSTKPEIKLRFKNRKVVRSLLLHGTLGLGEGYMDGDIEIDGDIALLLKIAAENHDLAPQIEKLQRIVRRNEKNVRQHQERQVRHHYSLGNDFYKLWLDESMTYSCAYFENGDETLEEAQDKKRELVLNKLELKPGMHLLDIGSGWGSLLLTAAQKYGVSGLGITPVPEQVEFANQRAKELGLSDKVRFERINYQDLPDRDEQFDRVVSVGMYEHVGKPEARIYFQVLRKILKADGLSVLHTISHSLENPTNPWIDRYIFPGGFIPAEWRVLQLIAETGFYHEHSENLGGHYALTLAEWQRRFEAAGDIIRQMPGKDERFIRMWRFYLATSRGSFEYGGMGLTQIVFRPQRGLARTHYYGPLKAT